MILQTVRWSTETANDFGFLYSQYIYIWNKWNRPTVSFYLIQAKSCMWFLVTKDNTALFRLRTLSSCECMSGAISWLFSKTKACRNNYMTAQCIRNICLHNIFHLYSSFSNTYKIGFCFQQNSIYFWKKYNSLLSHCCVAVCTVSSEFNAGSVSRCVELENVVYGKQSQSPW